MYCFVFFYHLKNVQNSEWPGLEVVEMRILGNFTIGNTVIWPAGSAIRLKQKAELWWFRFLLLPLSTFMSVSQKSWREYNISIESLFTKIFTLLSHLNRIFRAAAKAWWTNKVNVDLWGFLFSELVDSKSLAVNKQTLFENNPVPECLLMPPSPLLHSDITATEHHSLGNRIHWCNLCVS